MLKWQPCLVAPMILTTLGWFSLVIMMISSVMVSTTASCSDREFRQKDTCNHFVQSIKETSDNLFLNTNQQFFFKTTVIFLYQKKHTYWFYNHNMLKNLMTTQIWIGKQVEIKGLCSMNYKPCRLKYLWKMKLLPVYSTYGKQNQGKNFVYILTKKWEFCISLITW